MLITKLCSESKPCPGITFNIIVELNGQIVQRIGLLNGQSQRVTLDPGSFRIAEVENEPFAPIFSGACTRDGPLGSLTATGTISAGQNLHCTITNTQQP